MWSKNFFLNFTGKSGSLGLAFINLANLNVGLAISVKLSKHLLISGKVRLVLGSTSVFEINSLTVDSSDSANNLICVPLSLRSVARS